jgi:hypothetical protein
MDKINQITIEFKCYGHLKDAKRCHYKKYGVADWCAWSNNGVCSNYEAKLSALKEELEDMRIKPKEDFEAIKTI